MTRSRPFYRLARIAARTVASPQLHGRPAIDEGARIAVRALALPTLSLVISGDRKTMRLRDGRRRGVRGNSPALVRCRCLRVERQIRNVRDSFELRASQQVVATVNPARGSR